MANELGSEIRMLLGNMNVMSKSPSKLGSWNTFAKIYNIKGGSLYCSSWILLYYDFKLDFEDLSSSAHAAFTSQTSPPSLKGCVWIPDLYAKLPTQKQFAGIWASSKMFVIGPAMVSGALADELLTLIWPLAHGSKPCCHPGWLLCHPAGHMIASALAVDELSKCSCTERFAVLLWDDAWAKQANSSPCKVFGARSCI